MFALYLLLLLPFSMLGSTPEPKPSETLIETITITETITETVTTSCSDYEPQPTYADYKIDGEHWVGQISLDTYHETNLERSVCCEDLKIVNTGENIARSFAITLAFCRDNFDKVHSVWGYEYMIAEAEDATRLHIFSSDSVLNPGEQIVLPGFCVLVKKIKNFLGEKQLRFDFVKKNNF